MRIGIGYDVHRLTQGRRLRIGGVDISHDKGLDGHSDADVLVHAIMDAMLGALALGDIGKLFPDSAPTYKDIDSMLLLEQVGTMIDEKGWQIANIDSVIAAQKPKLAPYIDAMRSAIAAVLQIESTQVSVKATTTERLGFEGREEGISAQAVVLLRKK